MTVTRAARDASHGTIEAWLLTTHAAVVAETGRPIERLRIFRVSSTHAEQFAASLEAGLAASEQDAPDVVAARRVGARIVDTGSEGAALRTQLGTLTVTLDMLPGGEHSRQRLGYLTRFESGLFVYLLTTAAAPNLRDARQPEDRGNGAVETVRTLVRILSECGRRRDPDLRLRVHFTDETRAARSRSQAEKLIATLKQHQALVVLRGQEWDTTKTSDDQLVSILLGMAATERDLAVSRLQRGKLTLLLAHQLPEHAEQNAPFTHTVESASNGEGRGSHRLVPRPGAARQLADIVREVLAREAAARSRGERLDWDALAVDLSRRHQLRARGAAQTRGGRVVALHELAGPGGALRRMLAEPYRTAWRTGRMPWRTELIAEIEGLSDRFTIVDEHDGKPVIEAWIDCPQLEGLDISDAEWDELDRILTPTSARAGRPAGANQLPFQRLRWQRGDFEYALVPKTRDVYRVERRPLMHATHADGRRRGWPAKPDDRARQGVAHLASINANVLHRSIARALEQLCVELEGQTAPLTALGPPSETVRARRRDLEAELQRVATRLAELTPLIEGAKAERYRLAAEGDDAGRDAAIEDHDRYCRERDLLQARQCDLERQRAAVDTTPSASRDAEAEITSLEQLAAALGMSWDASAAVPREVRIAVRRVFRDSLVLIPNGAHVRWEAVVYVNLRDGAQALRRLEGTVANTMRGPESARSAEMIARRFLWEGVPLEQIGDELQIDGSGQKNSWLIQNLKRWLGTERGDAQHRRVIPSVDRRRVVLDAPLDARRAVYALLTGREAELINEGFDPAYLDVMRATYLDDDGPWFESWASADWTVHRRLTALVLAQEDPHAGIDVLSAARHLGIDYESLVALTGNRTKAGRRIPAAFERNWGRLQPPSMQERLIYLRECPHDDCPGHRLRHRDGQRLRAHLTHILHVPEVPDGVLCTYCRRAPGGPARYPESYLKAWRRKTLSRDGTRSGTTIDEHLSESLVTTRPWSAIP